MRTNLETLKAVKNWREYHRALKDFEAELRNAKQLSVDMMIITKVETNKAYLQGYVDTIKEVLGED